MNKKTGIISRGILVGGLSIILLLLAWQGYQRVKSPKRKRKAALW